MNPDAQKCLDAVPAARRALVERLHGLILELFQTAEVDLSKRMPTDRVGDDRVALANQKHDVPLYACGGHRLAAFKAANPGIATGKGCINFKPTTELPVDDVRTVIRHAIEHPTGG